MTGQQPGARVVPPAEARRIAEQYGSLPRLTQPERRLRDLAYTAVVLGEENVRLAKALNVQRVLEREAEKWAVRASVLGEENVRLAEALAAAEADRTRVVEFDVERACEVLHDAYESAAVGAGWETQQASRKPWAEVPEANQRTMRAAVTALLVALAGGDLGGQPEPGQPCCAHHVPGEAFYDMCCENCR